MNESIGSIVFWLPVVVAVLVAAGAGIWRDRSHRGPLLLQPGRRTRDLDTIRYFGEVGDSA